MENQERRKIIKDVRYKLAIHNASNNQKKKTNNLYFDKGNGQWGYVINMGFGAVLTYMMENNLKSLIDLGAGVGYSVEVSNDMGFKAKGYEIEDKFIEEHNNIFNNNNIIKKDIMTLKTQDIKDFAVIYIYQPFRDRTLMREFLNNLINILVSDQIILYKNDGVKPLNDNPTLEEISNKKTEFYHELEVFKK